MENIINTKSDINEFDKNENNKNKDSIKISNNTQENIDHIEKTKVDNSEINKINFPSNNLKQNNPIFNSNNLQTSFPLLFK